jgi:peptidyl-prolyl cis-trans isomerase B (cyclophilin B)
MKVKTLCWLLLMFIIAMAGLFTMSCGTSAKETTQKTGDATVIKFKDNGKMPPLLDDTSKKYTATIETEKGNLVLELFAKDVPNTVSNFVYLATKGFYDGTTFHRVIPDFMVQGGDPTGTGTGDPGYKFANEITSHKHVAGVLSMANSGGTNTNGSQFFITYVPTSWLDGKHTVFGQLVQGMDVLKKITPRDPATAKTSGDKLIKVTIKVE